MKKVPLRDRSGRVVAWTRVDDDVFRKYGNLNWCLGPKGRVWKRLDGKHVFLHRLVMRAPQGKWVDHKDCDPLNNQRRNLRFCTPRQNAQNQKVMAGKKFKGVHRVGRRFQARIGHKNIVLHLGVYETEEKAARAYNRAAKRLFGKFANLNKFK